MVDPDRRRGRARPGRTRGSRPRSPATVRVLRPARLSSQGVRAALATPAAHRAGGRVRRRRARPDRGHPVPRRGARRRSAPRGHRADRRRASHAIGSSAWWRSGATWRLASAGSARTPARSAVRWPSSATGGPATEAERVAGVEAGTAAARRRPLEGAGLCAAGRSSHFDHPLVRAAVLDDLGPSAAELHERAAELAMSAGEPERAAAHLAEVPGRASRERVDVLHTGRGAGAAERRARRRGTPPATRARGAARSMRPAGSVLFDLGMCELALGDAAAPDRLAAAADAHGSPDLRLRARMVSGHALTFMGRWAEAFDRMSDGDATARGAGAGLTSVSRASSSRSRCSPASRPGAKRYPRSTSSTARSPQDAPCDRSLEGALALRDVTFGRPRDGVLRRIRRAPSRCAPRSTRAAPLQGMPLIALVLADAFRRGARPPSRPSVDAVARRPPRPDDRAHPQRLAGAQPRPRAGGWPRRRRRRSPSTRGRAAHPAIAEHLGAIVRGSARARARRHHARPRHGPTVRSSTTRASPRPTSATGTSSCAGASALRRATPRTRTRCSPRPARPDAVGRREPPDHPVADPPGAGGERARARLTRRAT